MAEPAEKPPLHDDREELKRRRVRMKMLNLWIADVTSPDFQAEYPQHAFLPALCGLSPSYHDSLASQPPRLMKGIGVSLVSALVNSGFSTSEAQCIDRNKVSFGNYSSGGSRKQITWLNYSKFDQSGEATSKANIKEVQDI